MPTEIIHPENREHWLKCRAQDITSTEVGALFGISPYNTLFELWHRKKKGDIVELQENEFMKWGKRLQDAIAAGVAEDNGWRIRPMTEYLRRTELKMGSSFDFEITGNIVDERIHGGPVDTNGLLEIKNVFGLVFKDEWLEDEDGNLQAPMHIEIQVQHQLAVSGRAFAHIAALVGGNKVVLLKRLPNKSIIEAIETKVHAFWESVALGNEPEMNFKADAKFINELYSYAEPNTVFDAREHEIVTGIAAKHREATLLIKENEAIKKACKAELLTIIGDAEKTLGEGFSITAGMVGPAHVEFDRAGYRNFRINWPRGKKK